MSYVVRMRKNETGEIRECQMDMDWHKPQPDDPDWTDMFWWTEGNFACDCNRHDTFERAVGIEPSDEYDDDIPCGHHRFTVIEAILPDGTRIQIDRPIPNEGPVRL